MSSSGGDPSAGPWRYLARRKRWWLLPVAVLLGALAVAGWLAAGHAPDPIQYVIF